MFLRFISKGAFLSSFKRQLEGAKAMNFKIRFRVEIWLGVTRPFHMYTNLSESQILHL